jgi:hypothetical protein
MEDKDEIKRKLEETMRELRALNKEMYAPIGRICECYLDWYTHTVEDPEYDAGDDKLILHMDGLDFEIPLICVDILQIVENAVTDIKTFAESQMEGE